MNKIEFKQGKYYIARSNAASDYCFLWKCSENKRACFSHRIYTPYRSYDKNNNHSWFDNRFATLEEKHWLDCCITANKYIDKEEAMKTFHAEYVKCIKENPDNNINYKLGKVYKVNTNNGRVIGHTIHGIAPCNNTGITQFETSTKEEYDAQFVAKEPEFVLPEKWCVKGSYDNLKILNSFIHTNLTDYQNYNKSWSFSYANVYLHYPQCKSSYKCHSFQSIQEDYTEITFDQFKKYVLKEDIKVEELKQPSKDALIEEILEYCKKKYPVGTKVKSRFNYCNFTTTSIPYIQYNNIIVDCGINKRLFLFKREHRTSYIEIIEEVKPQTMNKVTVELGSRVYSLEELTKALTKEYDKDDAKEILKVIQSIK